MTKKKRGGPQPRSGRPKGPPTKVLSYRVPSDKADQIDKSIKELIQGTTEVQKLPFHTKLKRYE